MGKLIPLVAAQRMINGGNPKVFGLAPEVVFVNEDLITVIPPNVDNGLTTVIEHIPKAGGGQVVNEYLVYQTPEEVEVMRNPTTTDYALLQHKQVAVAGVGTTIATTLIMKAYNEITAIGAGATEAGRLPAYVANRCVYVVNNDASADPFKLFPNVVGESIDVGAGGAVYSQNAGTVRFYVALAATPNKWTVAINRGRR